MTAGCSPVLKLENVSVAYAGGAKAIDNVSVRINAGEFVCIVGPNGSGKTTLAKLFAGLLAPTSGSVELFGRTTADAVSLFEARSRIGYVFQNPDDQLVSTLVEDDVAFGPENLGIANPELRDRVDSALSKVRMGKYSKSNVETLSGGQKQRIAIASALALEPKALVLDEPCAMLDSKASQDAMQILEEANSNGCTIIMITHRMDEALSAKRVIALSDGRIAADAEPLEFFADPDLLKRLNIGEPALLKLCTSLIGHGVPVRPTQNEQDLEEQLCRLFSIK